MTNINLYTTIDIHSDNFIDGCYEAVENACIESGNNYSNVEMYDSYTIKVHFDTQESTANIQATLDAIKELKL